MTNTFPALVIMGTSEVFASTMRTGGRLGDEIIFVHRVADSVKCGLFSRSRALIFPSLREGFGLPIIEAHKFGRRVITSKRRPLSDLTIEGDILVSPLSHSQILTPSFKFTRS